MAQAALLTLAPRGRRRVRAVVVLAAALAATALAARLGAWQLDRAARKTALAEAIEARAALPDLATTALARSTGELEPQLHRRIRLEGIWLREHTVFLDNRQMNGRVGFHVITPLQIAPGDAVLVQRGWVPRNSRDRTALPALASPSGKVEVLGRIAGPPPKLYDFAAGEERGTIRQNIDLEQHARAVGAALRPLSVVQLVGPPADGLSRDWPLPAPDVHKHYGYAFQWFALAALIAGLYVWFQLIAPRLGRAA